MEAGHLETAKNLEVDIHYARAKTEVFVNQTMLSERMQPEMLDQIDDIVRYHWDKRKKELQHKKTVAMLQPQGSILEEVEHQIARRKKALLEGAAFYDAIDNIEDPINQVSGSFRS